MINLLFGTALMLGLASVVWMGSVFVGNDSAALSVTAVIGGVYLIGVFELFGNLHGECFKTLEDSIR